MMRRSSTWTRWIVVRGIVAAGLMASLLAMAGRSQEPELDVLKVIPENYRLVLENQFVRVIEARIPAGTEEPPHRHLRGVSVAMSDYTIEHKPEPVGQWVRNQRRLGTVYWSEAGVHQTRNVGTTPSHTIRMELKF